MAFMQKREITELRGRNIYHDKKNRTIYYDRFSKTGYVIPVGQFRTFNNYSSRFMLPILVFLLFSGVLFEKPLLNIPYATLIAGVVSIGFFLYMNYRFYKKFLPSLTILPRFVPESKGSWFSAVRKQDKKRVLVQIVLLILLGVLFILNTNQVFAVNGNEVSRITGYALSVGSFLYAIFLTIGVLKKD